MISRRDYLVGMGASALGGGLVACGEQSSARSNSGPWRIIRSGDYVTINGRKYEAECGPKTEAMQMTKDGVVRFSMLAENYWKKDSKWDSERTELDGWPTRFKYDRPIWSAWSMYYEPGEWSTSQWCIVRQIYHIKGWPMPHLLKPKGLLMWVGYAEGESKNSSVRHKQRIKQGEWIHFVETYKFDPVGGKGYWKSWLNGSQVLDYKGALGKKGATDCYAKFGIYRGIKMAWAARKNEHENPSGKRVRETVSIRYANLRFGHEDLSKYIDKPEEIPAWQPWPGNKT